MDALGAWLSSLASVPTSLVNAAGLIVAGVLAALVGVRGAAKISADAARIVANINRDAAQQVERIKSDGQRALERDRDHRQWRRERVAPALASAEQMWRLSALAFSLRPGGRDEAWERARDLLREAEDHQLVATLQALSFVGSTDLRSAINELVGAWERWTPEFRDFLACLETNVPYTTDPRRDWEWRLAEARRPLRDVFRLIEAYVYDEADPLHSSDRLKACTLLRITGTGVD